MSDSRLENERKFHDNRFIQDDDKLRSSVKKYYSINKIAKNKYYQLIKKYSKDKKLLEYGCGVGDNINTFNQFGAHVTGIDISEEGIKKTRELINSINIEADCFVMNVEKTEFNDNHFDVVVGTGIIHHLDLSKIYSETSRILNKNGHAVFFEPLGHNPIINLYRKLTPKLRTDDEHPLMNKDLKLLNKYFKNVNIQYFSLFTLLAVPFRKFIIFKPLFKALHLLDNLFLKLPFIKNWAWIVVIDVSNPIK